MAVHRGLVCCHTYPPCAPTPLQKRCLVVLCTTKIIYRLALTDAPSTKCVTIQYQSLRHCTPWRWTLSVAMVSAVGRASACRSFARLRSLSAVW